MTIKTIIRTALLASAALLLSACFPDTEITHENTEQIIRSGGSLSVLTKQTSTGFKSRINNQSLERFLVRTASTTTSECLEGKGTVLMSLSEDGASFSMVFDACAGENDVILNGTISGTFSEEGDIIETNMTGDLEARQGNNVITFDPIELNVKVTLSNTEIALYLAHEGQYHFNTESFRGTVTVKTLEPVGFSSSDMLYTGIVTYTDTAGNVLKVVHDNNGVHLYYNSTFLRSYSHVQWQESFQG